MKIPGPDHPISISENPKRVVVRFTAKLRLATAERTTVYWIVPGTGVVARDVEELVRVLGLPAKRVHDRIVLERESRGAGP